MDLRHALACIALFGGTASATPAFDLAPGQRVLAPLRHRQLAVFPVVQGGGDVDRTQYLTLSDGLKQKLVAVAEKGAGGEVNRVQVRNKSDKPLLLLGGEIILGGQQDRIIGKDTILPAHESATVEVFCVEHGRWSGNREFHGSGGLVEAKTRVSAKYHSNQGAVWAQVAKKTDALDGASSTGTYRTLATGAAGQRATKPFRDAIAPALAKLPEHKDLIGLISAVNGRVTSVDLFANPTLFAAYQDRLLDSIFVTAADVAPTPAAEKPPTAVEIKSFMAKAEAAREEQLLVNKAGRTIEKKGKGVMNSKVVPAAAPAAPPPKAAYDSYQADE
jgi:hypothetical protein